MAANKERGELALQVGDKSYVMKMTPNSVCQMETLSGRSHDQTMQRIHEGWMTDVRLYLWASLIERQPQLTVLDVGNLIADAGGLGGIKSQIEALVKLNTEEAQGLAPSNGNPP